MQSDNQSPRHPAPVVGETNADYRRRAEELQAEAAERRQQQIDQQSSPLNTPSVRIQAWERLHEVRLPRDPAHRLVNVIAANTGLSVAEVRAEQIERAAASTEPPGTRTSS